MEQELRPCTHAFDDRAALLKDSMWKDSWQLKRTCTLCGEVLYPTKGTLTLMGIVDKMCYTFSLTLGFFFARTLLCDFPILVKFVIGLAACLLSCGILRLVTRPILLATRWQQMEARIRDVPREEVLRAWYGKTWFWTLICFTAIVLVIYLIFF